MRGSRKLLVGTLAVGIALGAAGVVVAGFGANTVSGDTDRQVVSWTGREEVSSRNWRPVPEIVDPISSSEGQSYAVSAQMQKGAVKVRIVRPSDGDVTPPGPVLFSSKATNSFTFAVLDTCGIGESRELQWKRVGRRPAVALKLSTHAIWSSVLCV